MIQFFLMTINFIYNYVAPRFRRKKGQIFRDSMSQNSDFQRDWGIGGGEGGFNPKKTPVEEYGYFL